MIQFSAISNGFQKEKRLRQTETHKIIYKTAVCFIAADEKTAPHSLFPSRFFIVGAISLPLPPSTTLFLLFCYKIRSFLGESLIIYYYCVSKLIY